jgi:hypothetical protein
VAEVVCKEGTKVKRHGRIRRRPATGGDCGQLPYREPAEESTTTEQHVLPRPLLSAPWLVESGAQTVARKQEHNCHGVNVRYGAQSAISQLALGQSSDIEVALRERYVQLCYGTCDRAPPTSPSMRPRFTHHAGYGVCWSQRILCDLPGRHITRAIPSGITVVPGGGAWALERA